MPADLIWISSLNTTFVGLSVFVLHLKNHPHVSLSTEPHATSVNCVLTLFQQHVLVLQVNAC